MSHTVTVTRTTTTSTTSAILLNIGYFKKPIGILKLLHVLLGIVVVGIIGHYISYYYVAGHFQATALFTPELFLLLIATTCMIASAILLFCCFISIATATIMPKTIFELLFHGFATVFCLIAGAIYVAKLHDWARYVFYGYNARLAAGEFVQFSTFTFLMLIASMVCLGKVISRNALYKENSIMEPGYVAKIFASVIALINAILYGAASYFSFKAYKGA